jgi:outer membrane protein assembly factor BamB
MGAAFRIPRLGRALAAFALLAVLAGCADDDAPLPGERIPVRPEMVPVGETTTLRAVPLPPQRANADWTHRNGSADGRIAHPALAPSPQLRWSTDIGEGSSRRARILTGPIVAGGLIYTIDAGGQLTAVARNGGVVWRRSLVPEGQNADSGPGGGLAVSGGVLYATTGFGEVMALRPGDGAEIWRRGFEGPIRAAPTVSGGRIYVVVRNDTGYALDPRNGETLWRVQGAGGPGLLGGATVATDGQLVAMPFASGEVLGVLARNGLQVWGTAVTGGRRDLARNRINDISGDPVFDGPVIYASNQSGRTVAIEAATGERLWTMPEGAYGPAWPVGGSLFLLSDRGALVRADADTGEILWSVQLPAYTERRRLFRSPVPWDAQTYYGPVLAGGRLWVAGGDGLLRAFSPNDGRPLGELAIPGGAAAAPVVAGGVMYVVSSDGNLLAFQ